LESSKLKPSTSGQINKFKRRSLKQCSGQIGCTWTFDFLFWVEKYTQIPEDDEEAYVVSYEYELRKSNSIKIKNLKYFMKTKRLSTLDKELLLPSCSF